MENVLLRLPFKYLPMWRLKKPNKTCGILLLICSAVWTSCHSRHE